MSFLVGCYIFPLTTSLWGAWNPFLSHYRYSLVIIVDRQWSSQNFAAISIRYSNRGKNHHCTSAINVNGTILNGYWIAHERAASGQNTRREEGKWKPFSRHSLLVFSVIRKKKECSYSDHHPIWFGNTGDNKKTTSSVNNEDQSPLTISEDRGVLVIVTDRVLLPILLEAVSSKGSICMSGRVR